MKWGFWRKTAEQHRIDEKDLPEEVKEAVLKWQGGSCAFGPESLFLVFFRKDPKKPLTADNVIAVCPLHAKSVMRIWNERKE